MASSPSTADPGSANPVAPPANASRQGVLFGLTAYIIWGSFPVYFKALAGAGPLEIVCHRFFWSAVLLLLLVAVRRQLGQVWQAFRDRALLATLCGSTLLIAANWLVFLFALQQNQVLQSSLGYFMTPLVSVLLGLVVLRERLNRWQQASVLAAFLGVLILTVHQGVLPWIALTLAGSFGLYGLLRKMARVDALIGVTVETLLLAPFALGYLVHLRTQGQGAFLAGSALLDTLLPFSGVVTAVPLLCFVAAARRLRLTTIGFLQYITPTLHFIFAVGLYGEPFGRGQLLSFLFIWIGLGIFSADAIWKNRKLWRGTSPRAPT
jgi:chloramphenicol-sensitive protein RarD